MKKRIRRKLLSYSIGILVGLLILGSLLTFAILGPFRSLFWSLPSMLGFFGPKTYLILLQNNNELRPTGGFITAVAEVSFLFGFPSLTVLDSYQVPDPKPKIPAPEPFEYFIGRNDPFFAGWTLRDANFSPDFSKSSQDIIALYESAYPGSTIHGVFALDFTVIEALLEQHGPFDVEGMRFDKDNFFLLSQKISKDIDTHDTAQLETRKSIMKPFASAFFNKILKNPFQYGSLMTTLSDLGKKKHVLAYSPAPSLQKQFDDLGLANTLRPAPENEDLLHVSIANIGGRKADRYLIKDIRSVVDFSNPEHPESRAEIALEHLGSYNLQSDIYQAYVRTYVPRSSRLLQSSGATLRGTEVFEDLGFTVFADYLRIKPGEKITLTYRYRLPETIFPEDYTLNLVKQPGTEHISYHAAIKTLNDSNFVVATDSEKSVLIRENLAFSQGEIEKDLRFHLLQGVDTQGPMVQWQEFQSLTLVNVRFQELIEPSNVKPENFQMIDLNKKNPETDEITVTKARFDQRDLWLTVEGVTAQPEEHYQLVVKDIRDIHGNLIEVNPLIRTLVQRIP